MHLLGNIKERLRYKSISKRANLFIGKAFFAPFSFFFLISFCHQHSCFAFGSRAFFFLLALWVCLHLFSSLGAPAFIVQYYLSYQQKLICPDKAMMDPISPSGWLRLRRRLDTQDEILTDIVFMSTLKNVAKKNYYDIIVFALPKLGCE